MISDQEFLQGATLLRLINYGYRITITHASWIHSSIYLIESDSSQSVVLFKLSKKPKSAWAFTLSSQEESALSIVHSKYPEFSVFIAFICHKDGICCVGEERLRRVLDTDTGIAGQHISVARQPHASYHVSGPGRQPMAQTIPQSDWPRVVLLNPKTIYE